MSVCRTAQPVRHARAPQQQGAFIPRPELHAADGRPDFRTDPVLPHSKRTRTIRPRAAVAHPRIVWHAQRPLVYRGWCEAAIHGGIEETRACLRPQKALVTAGAKCGNRFAGEVVGSGPLQAYRYRGSAEARVVLRGVERPQVPAVGGQEREDPAEL